MKRLFKHVMLTAALLVMMAATCQAQKSLEVEKKVSEIVSRYSGTAGVNCFTVTKGNGLEVLKMMMNKEFGKSFMKGVRSITLIEYGDASKEIYQAVHDELNIFSSLLEEFTISEEEQFAGHDFIRCFASTPDEKTISDFVIVLENETDRVFMYMAGEMNFE